MKIMSQFSEEVKRMAWNKANSIDGLDSNLFRKDPCGALIVWDKYGAIENEYGWEIDHIIPRSLLEEKGIAAEKIDAPQNLRAMHHKNNLSKADNYPTYLSAVTSNSEGVNVENREVIVVNAKVRERLNNFYGLQL